jgi:general nucleoside transport system permease protein
MEFLFSVIRMASPLLFASMGGLFSERAGVINIALEAFMLIGALTGAVVTLVTGSPYLGFAAAAGAGALFALLYAACVIHGRANQVVAGTAMNLLAVGFIPFTLKYLYDTSGGTPAIPIGQRFQTFPLWGAAVVSFATWALMAKTPFGLWVSFSGEKPEAVDAAGLSVRKIRYGAVLLSGALAALGGATLSLCLSSGYSRNMVAGRGFMALAALILGKWRPAYAVAGCLFFGFMEALQIRLQSVDLSGGVGIPSQFIVVIPYIATILVLAGFIGHSRAPKALGVPFDKA